ncbi:MAG: hypothetical protein OEW70_07630, partial [candidate division WOR-3 bacterium]|nr:hypothetical protein [candidate division WOR-3 bacterium]
MTTIDKNNTSLEPWEEELFAMHRWGRFAFWFKQENPQGKEELARLRKLWTKAQPLEESAITLLNQITALEICNWKLEESIIALCEAIGKKNPTKLPIGHMASISKERWEKFWTYYLTLRNWVPHEAKNGYEVLLRIYDSNQLVQNHILGMLGERDKLKEVYVERLGLCLERYLAGFPTEDSPWMKAHNSAVTAIDVEIKKLDPESKVVHELVLKDDGSGRLQPCNHKAFYRYDLIISSIGVGNWRGAMGKRGTDGLERADILEKYLSPIESWIQGR